MREAQLAEIANRRNATPQALQADIDTLVAEVRRQNARLYDFEDGHAYTKVRRDADYWHAHYENDKFEIENLVAELFAVKAEAEQLRAELAAAKGVAA